MKYTVGMFGAGFAKLALEKGALPGLPFRTTTIGSTIQGQLSAPERPVIVGFEVPPLIEGDDTIYVNIATNAVYLPAADYSAWVPVPIYQDSGDLFLYFNSDNGGNSTGNGGGTVQPGASGIVKYDTLSDMQTATVPDDGVVVYVEGEKSLFAYDAQGNATVDDPANGIYTAQGGVGHWQLISNAQAAAAISNVDGGLF